MKAIYSSTLPSHLISDAPSARSNRSGLGSTGRTFRKTASPFPVASIITCVPGLIPRESRTSLGMVTCPLLVTVVATGPPLVLLLYYCNTEFTPNPEGRPRGGPRQRMHTHRSERV